MIKRQVAILSSTHTLAAPSTRYLLFSQVKDMLGASDTALRRLVGDKTKLLEDKETIASLK